MNKLLLIVSIAISVCFCEPAATKSKNSNDLSKSKCDLSRIVKYLGDMKNVYANFLQISEDGTISTGVLYVKKILKNKFNKITKIKMYYNSPDNNVVIIDGSCLKKYDRELEEQSDVSILSSPMSFLVRYNDNIEEKLEVLSFSETSAEYRLKVCKKNYEDNQAVELIFNKKNNQLSGWILYRDKNSNAQDNMTVIYLTKAKYPTDISDLCFQTFALTDPSGNKINKK